MEFCNHTFGTAYAQGSFENYILKTYAPNNMLDIDVFKSNVYKMLRNIKICISENIPCA